ncbi:hypothetical protein CYFUS_008368 [Cystobacter fuscus]|uniref:Uncharacterized protein n=1 Tax=Cystobacter fuscus TaxID=43 RepID=A0A250JG66_9BACT|nr:hypothetical protein [Cystobacter fuscus]ATB42889.1 hypothetical protein CYFUS_008368 [Cystobacter fuscus]
MNDSRPSVLFHGSAIADIAVLEPRRIFMPGEVDPEQWPALVYASDLAAFAAAHAFPWDSEDGFQLSVDFHQRVKMRVPRALSELLGRPVYLYTVSAEGFEQTREEITGHTFHCGRLVPVMACKAFDSVEAAIHFHGGVVTYF